MGEPKVRRGFIDMKLLPGVLAAARRPRKTRQGVYDPSGS
jgi:hypothetical protein